MTEGLTSIIIPTFNHSGLVLDAVRSALAQTAPVEVVVVDDGSTDDTSERLDVVEDERFSYIKTTHKGPSDARNVGIERARGEYLMLLDADDLIAATKVEEQVAQFDPSIGWVLCDVRIEDAVRGRVELASERYRYAERNLGGWMREQLAPANFIPIMSPIVRRSLLADDIRFGYLLPEDWHFWYAVAGRGRVRYLPKVLATYRKQRLGRNASRRGVAHVSPESVGGPLLLNLGCGTPGARSWHPMPGCVNLDRSLGWCFEDGLGQYGDDTVDGITVSHALMYVDAFDWPKVFHEFARVLKPGGVIRITEDDSLNPKSGRYGGWRGSEPATTMMDASTVIDVLNHVGLTASEVPIDDSQFGSMALVQAQHGLPPDVFFVEGVK